MIRNRAIRLTDISTRAREALHGQQGPPGTPAMPFRAAVSTGGVAALGNARTVEHVSGTNEYRIDFGRNPTSCIFSATLAAVQAGPVLEQPQAGRVTVGRDSTRVIVRTFGVSGTPSEQPFHVAMAC